MGAFWLVRRLSNNWTLAVLSQAFLACLSFYLFYSSIDSTDALAAGLQLCSLALLLGDTSQRRVAFGAGMLAGLSYLIRYTASLTILLSALFLLGLAVARRQRRVSSDRGRIDHPRRITVGEMRDQHTTADPRHAVAISPGARQRNRSGFG